MSTTTSPSVHPTNNSRLTLPPITKDYTLPTATEEFKPKESTGLLPKEIFIVIFTALGLASCCFPFVFFFALRKRKKTAASRQTASPETEIEEDMILVDGSQLLDRWPPSPLPSNTSSFVNPSYNRRGTVESMQVVPEWSRARQQNPLQPRSNENKFPEPQAKPYLEHRASLICEKMQNSEQTSKDYLEINHGGKRKVDWKESVQKIREKRRQERKHFIDLSEKLSEEEEEEEEYGEPVSTNVHQEKTHNYRREAENMASTSNSSSITKTPFKQGFIDCDVDTIVAEDQKTSGHKGKYRRSQSNRDISMATFRILDNSNRRQSFQISSQSSPRSLLRAKGGVPTSNEQWRHDFETTTRVEHNRPGEAWAKPKKPRLTSRISSLI